MPSQASSLDHTLAVVQAGSGLAFSTFSLLHLSGHLLANVRYLYASSALYIFREYYQTPAVEVAVVGGSILAHGLSSYGRMYLRSLRAAKSSKGSSKATASGGSARHGETSADKVVRQHQLHQLTGYILSGLVMGHISATRLAPLLFMKDPSMIDLTYASYAALKMPGIMHTYYWILGFAGMYHTTYGISAALRTLKIGALPRVSARAWDWITLGMGLAMASTVLALTGVYEPLYIPMARHWDALAVQVVGLLPLSLRGLLG
ncbi:hypothetical protein BC831DRAFT_482582 [Entophlyctis helioformis]|nr:hypothetical protein BC831DRAFT_482582 [Entophlyctis helioformis]